MNHIKIFLFVLAASLFTLGCHPRIAKIQKSVEDIDSIRLAESSEIDKSNYQFTRYNEESGLPIGITANICKSESEIIYAEFDIVGDLAGNKQQCYFENGRLIYGKTVYWSQNRNNIVEKREFFYKGNSQPVFPEQSNKSDTKTEYEKAAIRFEVSVTELLQYIDDNIHFFNVQKIRSPELNGDTGANKDEK